MLLRKLISQVRLLFFVTTVVYSQEEEHAENNEEESKQESVDFGAVNLCDIESPTIIYCYCNTVEENQAHDGNCWIFNDTSEKKFSEVWESFASQSTMKHLTLHLRPDGTLKKIPTVAIMFLPELERFEVQYASVNSLHSFCFGNSSTVESISLTRNGIELMESNSISNLPSLVTLKLGENQLTAINSSVFSNLPNLKQLFMDRNNISNIQNFAFKQLNQLLELELFVNHIQAIVPETFVGLTSLKRLDLHKNLLQVISDKSFKDLKSLEYLNLMSNSIKYVAPKGLHGLKNLKTLNLQDNKLIFLEEDIFKYTPNLIHLDLRQNVLETLTVDTIKPLSKNLRNTSMSFYIKDNVFRCDNRLLWIFKLYNNTKSRNVKSSLEEVFCYFEVGVLPSRLEDQTGYTTPVYEITTMGIGPRTELLKLRPSELPDPLIRTPATFTQDEDCEEEHRHPSKKISDKNKNRRKHGRSKTNANRRKQTEASEEDAQNDAIVSSSSSSLDRTHDSNRDSSDIEIERNSQEMQSAAPVQGQPSHGIINRPTPSLLFLITFFFFLKRSWEYNIY